MHLPAGSYEQQRPMNSNSDEQQRPMNSNSDEQQRPKFEIEANDY